MDSFNRMLIIAVYEVILITCRPLSIDLCVMLPAMHIRLDFYTSIPTKVKAEENW